MVPDRVSECYPRNLWLVRPQPPEEEPGGLYLRGRKMGLVSAHLSWTTAQACCLNGRLPKRARVCPGRPLNENSISHRQSARSEEGVSELVSRDLCQLTFELTCMYL